LTSVGGWRDDEAGGRAEQTADGHGQDNQETDNSAMVVERSRGVGARHFPPVSMH
jgi:hypothetical protein